MHVIFFSTQRAAVEPLSLPQKHTSWAESGMATDLLVEMQRQSDAASTPAKAQQQLHARMGEEIGWLAEARENETRNEGSKAMGSGFMNEMRDQ